MKKEYKDVQIEVVRFEAEDIITTSSCDEESAHIID